MSKTNAKYNISGVKSSIKIAENVIKVGLIASGLQLTYAFAYDNVISWFAAGFKAAFIEVSVWILTQAMLRSHILPSRSRLFLWLLLFAIFLISTRANLQYEIKHIIDSKKDAVFAFEYELTFMDYVDAWLRSALLPALILGLIYGRLLIEKGFYAYQQEELRRLQQRERSRRYREKRKKLEDEFRSTSKGGKDERGLLRY